MPANEELRHLYLRSLGLTVWERRRATEEAAQAMPRPPPPAVPQIEAAGDVAIDALDWGALRSRVAACVACGLHQTRTQTVFGTGAAEAQWMMVGEAPGADEDRQGEPFVGRAGQLLNAMLLAIGLQRKEVYIANILKCRPPRNRDPQPEEVSRCIPYLHRQVALVRPRIILALGRISAQNLLQTSVPIGRLRGRVHHFGDAGTPVVVTYHPAYLLRSPMEKRKAWQDLCLARRVVEDGV